MDLTKSKNKLTILSDTTDIHRQDVPLTHMNSNHSVKIRQAWFMSTWWYSDTRRDLQEWLGFKVVNKIILVPFSNTVVVWGLFLFYLVLQLNPLLLPPSQNLHGQEFCSGSLLNPVAGAGTGNTESIWQKLMITEKERKIYCHSSADGKLWILDMVRIVSQG